MWNSSDDRSNNYISKNNKKYGQIIKMKGMLSYVNGIDNNGTTNKSGNFSKHTNAYSSNGNFNF